MRSTRGSRVDRLAVPRLARIVEGLTRLSGPVVFPAHPRTRAALEAEKLRLDRIVRLDPLGYLDLAALASHARVIVTDSGGLQKEAYWHGVPCVTTRTSTEWVDTVEIGANVLVDDDPDALEAAVERARPLPDDRPCLYGDGRAAERIAVAVAHAPSTGPARASRRGSPSPKWRGRPPRAGRPGAN